MAITYKKVDGKVEEYDDSKPTRTLNKEDVESELAQIDREISDLTDRKAALEADRATIVKELEAKL